MSQPTITLTPGQAEAFGRELDAIKERVMADLGERDADYIRTVIKTQRALEIGGRAMLFGGIIPPFWLAGTAMLALSKILDNMEIGHNVMHGQYDWMRDPSISGRSFEWDTACPADQWRHSHNYMHHTHTNIVGMDRDIGYGILRMSEDQRWHPYYLGNPVYAFLLMALFQYGVALHELETERMRAGEISLADKRETLKGIWRKTRRQLLKDYVAFPLLAGPFAPFVLTGNLSANLIRNVWSYMIIFCGHFPDGTQEFSIEETQNESRGMWYFRQILGSANLTGGKLFHLLSGNLSHQIEHHLFPDMPALRYAEIAPEVLVICERYGIRYNSGPLLRQFGTVVRKIVKLTLPPKNSPRRAVQEAESAAAEGGSWPRLRGWPLCPAISDSCLRRIAVRRANHMVLDALSARVPQRICRRGKGFRGSVAEFLRITQPDGQRPQRGGGDQEIEHRVGAALKAVGGQQLEDHAPAPGTPSREETIDRYQRLTGHRLTNLRFSDVTSALLLAVALVRLNTKLAMDSVDLAEICAQRVEFVLGGD